jgi:hypothetical protein
MVINRSAFSKALWPGINAWIGEGYGEHPLELSELFSTYNSDKAFEEDVSISGFGLFSTGSEGANVTYDSMQQGFVTRYTHLKYFSGFIITSEMIDDDQYMNVGKKRANALGFSARQTQEIVAANVYNRAFNSSYTGGDTKELLSTGHLNVAGGTYSNKIATDADLSEAALEQAAIDIMAFTNDRGLKIPVQITALVIPTALVFEAERILKSPLQSGSAQNDVNVLKMAGTIPKIVKNHYLTDSDAWFLRTNCPDGMKRFVRKAFSPSEDNDFDSDNLKYKAVYRESYGWSDPRGLYGSAGA